MKRREFITRTGTSVGAGLTAFAASRRAHVVHASSPQHSPVPAQLPEPAAVQQPKVIDPSGITTEFIRCPDPTRVVVAKITRRRV
jgi:hypothetical protein